MGQRAENPGAENPGYDKHSFAGRLRRSLRHFDSSLFPLIFHELAGAGTMASRGSAAYLTISHRK
jgi:hypothetical protein